MLILRRLQIWLIGLVTIAAFLISTPAIAQQPTPTGNPVDGFPVVFNGETLFQVKEGIPGVVTARERAAIITDRLQTIARDSTIPLEGIRIEEAPNESILKGGEIVLFTIREKDALSGQQSRSVLAQKALEKVKAAIARDRDERSVKTIVSDLLLVVLSTVAWLAVFKSQQWLFSKLLRQLQSARQAQTLRLRWQNTQLLGSAATSYLLGGSLRFIQMAVILSSLYFYVPFALSHIPATRALGVGILSLIAYQMNQLAQAMVQSLPNLIIIGLIALTTYYVIGFVKLVIVELGREDAFPWFYPEWIRPTIRLATFLMIAIACVVAAPYLPGFGSPAFQGVSLFVGALVTLGSSSTVANIIAGIILIYARTFRIGDVIRLAEVSGIVIEKSLFVTRVQTFKKEIITLPNSTVLSNNVTNFSAILRTSGGYLVLYTTVTLGYDTAWIKVYEALTEAAKKTTHILSEPAPFVLQTALNDYHISYQLNACTDRPDLMAQLYSELHQNIQDSCNQAGIEILSPAYAALRDGNHSTIPEPYLPLDYQSPGFQISSQNHPAS